MVRFFALLLFVFSSMVSCGHMRSVRMSHRPAPPWHALAAARRDRGGARLTLSATAARMASSESESESVRAPSISNSAALERLRRAGCAAQGALHTSQRNACQKKNAQSQQPYTRECCSVPTARHPSPSSVTPAARILCKGCSAHHV